MEKVYNKLLHEEYFKEVLDNGLTVLLCKRPSIKNATAMLTVKYGSLHPTNHIPIAFISSFTTCCFIMLLDHIVHYHE